MLIIIDSNCVSVLINSNLIMLLIIILRVRLIIKTQSSRLSWRHNNQVVHDHRALGGGKGGGRSNKIMPNFCMLEKLG